MKYKFWGVLMATTAILAGCSQATDGDKPSSYQNSIYKATVDHTKDDEEYITNMKNKIQTIAEEEKKEQEEEKARIEAEEKAKKEAEEKAAAEKAAQEKAAKDKAAKDAQAKKAPASDGTASGAVLGTFTTNFDPSNSNRANNIQIAASTINGVTVKPGATFSYNATLGPTNTANGYKEATVIQNGQETKGVGGGVCQVSSTLFNAVDNAGLKTTERHNHSKAVKYVASGRDAATSSGGIDYKFVNNKDYPVKIAASASGGSITVSIVKA